MAGKLKTLFGKAAELEGRVSRRVGALGGKAKKEGDDVYSVADKAAPGGRRRARGEKGAAKSGKANEVKDLTSSGRRRIVGGASVAGSATYLASKDDKPKKPKEKDYTKGSSKGGVSFNESFAHHREKLGAGKTFTWNGNKYTTDRADDKKTTSAKETTSSNTPAKAKKVGIIKKLLFGSDGKMGGKSGIIDNKVTRAFTKRDEENLAAGLVKKQAGGMMKSKGYNKGGAVGMSKPGNEKLPMATKAPKLSSVQENLLRQAQSYAKETGQNPAEVKRLTGMYGDLNAAKEAEMSAATGKRPSTMRSGPREEKLAAAKNAMAMRGAAGRRSGGSTPRGMNMGGSAMKSKMASKGGKMGGKMAPGYKNGGTVGKKSARGVGAAKRGFGRAMR
jgi:hypothetical protein